MVMKLNLTLLSLFMFMQISHAENTLNHRYSYDELKIIAFENNAELRTLFHQWRAVLSNIAVARSLPNPMLSYTEYLEEVQTRVGPQKRKVMVSQMIPWFGTLSLRGDAISKKAVILNQKIEMAELKILKEIKSNVYDLILIDQKIDINQQHEDTLKDLEKSLKGLVASGKTDLANVLRVQVEIDKFEDRILTLNAMKEPIVRNLESIINGKLKKALPSSMTISGTVPAESLLIKLYKKNNPEWKINKTNQNLAGINVNLAKKKNYPDLGLGFTWIETDSTVMANSGDDPLMLTFNFSLPLWRKKINSQITSSQEVLKSYQYQSNDLYSKFLSKLKLLLFKIDDSNRKIKLYENSLIEKSKTAYLASKKSHEAGETTFQNVLDAERVLLKFMLDIEISKVEREKNIIDLESIVGPIY